jgi:hypothetical protein
MLVRLTTILRLAFAATMAMLVLGPAARAQDAALNPDLATVRLSAALAGSATPLDGGLRWRIFTAEADGSGARSLIAKSSTAQPILSLPAGDYVLHVAFGLASAAKRITLGREVRAERLTLAAGVLRVMGTVGDKPIDPGKLSLAVYVPERRNPEGKLVYAKAHAGDFIGLPEGNYHIVSTYLDTVGIGSVSGSASAGGNAAPAAPTAATPTNSIVNADIKVVSGKEIDVTLRHRCATATLKLVNEPGAEALANSSFTVLTPGGDLIRELVGAFPSLVLAEGEYAVIARHDGKTYQSTFQVQSGLDRDVEVIAQHGAKQEP